MRAYTWAIWQAIKVTQMVEMRCELEHRVLNNNELLVKL